MLGEWWTSGLPPIGVTLFGTILAGLAVALIARQLARCAWTDSRHLRPSKDTQKKAALPPQCGDEDDGCFEATLQRSSSNEVWGFAWNVGAHSAQRLIVAGVDPASPAGQWSSEQRSFGGRPICRGDEVVSVNGESSYPCLRTELSSSLRLCMSLRCASAVVASVGSPHASTSSSMSPVRVALSEGADSPGNVLSALALRRANRFAGVAEIGSPSGRAVAANVLSEGRADVQGGVSRGPLLTDAVVQAETSSATSVATAPACVSQPPASPGGRGRREPVSCSVKNTFIEVQMEDPADSDEDVNQKRLMMSDPTPVVRAAANLDFNSSKGVPATGTPPVTDSGSAGGPGSQSGMDSSSTFHSQTGGAKLPAFVFPQTPEMRSQGFDQPLMFPPCFVSAALPVPAQVPKSPPPTMPAPMVVPAPEPPPAPSAPGDKKTRSEITQDSVENTACQRPAPERFSPSSPHGSEFSTSRSTQKSGWKPTLRGPSPSTFRSDDAEANADLTVGCDTPATRPGLPLVKQNTVGITHESLIAGAESVEDEASCGRTRLHTAETKELLLSTAPPASSVHSGITPRGADTPSSPTSPSCNRASPRVEATRSDVEIDGASSDGIEAPQSGKTRKPTRRGGRRARHRKLAAMARMQEFAANEAKGTESAAGLAATPPAELITSPTDTSKSAAENSPQTVRRGGRPPKKSALAATNTANSSSGGNGHWIDKGSLADASPGSMSLGSPADPREFLSPDARERHETGADLIGKRVLIRGLVHSPEFNGQWSRVESYDSEMQRYLVNVFLGGEATDQPVWAKLRRDNLVVPKTVELKFEDRVQEGLGDVHAIRETFDFSAVKVLAPVHAPSLIPPLPIGSASPSSPPLASPTTANEWCSEPAFVPYPTPSSIPPLNGGMSNEDIFSVLPSMPLAFSPERQLLSGFQVSQDLAPGPAADFEDSCAALLAAGCGGSACSVSSFGRGSSDGGRRTSRNQRTSAPTLESEEGIAGEACVTPSTRSNLLSSTVGGGTPAAVKRGSLLDLGVG